MNILKSIKLGVPKLKFVSIDKKAIQQFTTSIKRKDLEISEIELSKCNWDINDLLQLTFYFNSMNFCFWAEKNKPKWTVNIEGQELDGSIALFRLLESQLRQNPTFLDSNSILNMKFEDFEKYFKGNVQIPLIKERYHNFRKSAEVIGAKYKGSFSKILVQADSDASKLLNIIAENFTSFEDSSTYKGTKVDFLKRAQLQVKMTHDALISENQQGLKNLDVLTAFADYKVPQMLRHFKIMTYNKELADRIDHFELIEKDSEMENEIRIATIWAVELIRYEVSRNYPEVTASHIDSYLWKKFQTTDKSKVKPYHRTYTTAY